MSEHEHDVACSFGSPTCPAFAEPAPARRPGPLARWKAHREEVHARREADDRYRDLLDRFITAGEAYLDAWVDSFDRAREVAAVQRDYPPATVGPDVAAQARTSEEAARHDGRAHLDAGDPGIKAIVSGCPACITRPGGTR